MQKRKMKMFYRKEVRQVNKTCCCLPRPLLIQTGNHTRQINKTTWLKGWLPENLCALLTLDVGLPCCSICFPNPDPFCLKKASHLLQETFREAPILASNFPELQNQEEDLDMVAYAFNPSTLGDRGRQIFVNWRPALSTQLAPGQPEPHSKTLSQNKQTK